MLFRYFAVFAATAGWVFGADQAVLSKATLDLSLEPPVINTDPGPEHDDQVRTGNMVIGMERTAKGRLWACWVGNGDNPNGFFMLATSDDGGAKWSKPRVVIDPTDPPNSPQRRALVGNLWTDPTASATSTDAAAIGLSAATIPTPRSLYGRSRCVSPTAAR